MKLPAFLGEKLSPRQVAQLEAYATLLQEVNTRINLISRRDIAWIWEHHLVPSLCFLGWWRLPEGNRVLDVGTGGGLPGIPLAIAHPDTAFVLIDSTRKKVEAVRRIVQALSLQERIEVRWGRVEEQKETFPVVLGRAVAPLPRFLGWIKRILKPEGEVFYYTGEPWGPLPAGWQGHFYPFSALLPDWDYLQGKGILHLRPKRTEKSSPNLLAKGK